MLDLNCLQRHGVDLGGGRSKEKDASLLQWRNEYREYGDYNLSGSPFGNSSDNFVAYGKIQGTGNYNYAYPSECHSSASLKKSYKGWATAKSIEVNNANLIENVYWGLGRRYKDDWWNINCSNGPVSFWRSHWSSTWEPVVEINKCGYSQLMCEIDRKAITSELLTSKFGDEPGWEIID